MQQLRIPGPTPCPPDILKAISRQMINHRGKEFAEIIHDVTAKLKEVFQTKNDVFVLTSSGTGGMEAAVVNTLSPGDKVLATCCGFFGDRFAEIARVYGAAVKCLDFEWGKPVDPDAVRKALKDDPGVKAVLVTHNETSTGVTNDLKSISTIAKEFDKLILVDAISGLGSIDLPVDSWQCDVVVTASQKGWMVPPGLAMVSVSEKAWQAHAKASMPRYYWDFTSAKNYLEKGQTPTTPAVSVFFGLAVALDMMLAEGLPNLFARHARIAALARDGVKSLGLSIFPEERYASDTVTAIRAADKLDVFKLLKLLREKHGVVLAGGQGSLAGKIFRIGHLGWITESDIKQVLHAIGEVIPQASS
ncbi:MAG TPA: alanine--glyoxylate aminotransferase family protein [Dehalococcoidia bacterium]|nr:alanine--glyoxylate aminotransferase family protein [Dehalococcoidia bacterium]